MPCIGVAKPAISISESRIRRMDTVSTTFGRFFELLPCSKGRRFGLWYDQRFPCLWVSSCSFFPRPKFKRTETRQGHLFSCHDGVYDAFQGRIQRQCSVFFGESRFFCDEVGQFSLPDASHLQGTSTTRADTSCSGGGVFSQKHLHASICVSSARRSRVVRGPRSIRRPSVPSCVGGVGRSPSHRRCNAQHAWFLRTKHVRSDRLPSHVCEDEAKQDAPIAAATCVVVVHHTHVQSVRKGVEVPIERKRNSQSEGKEARVRTRVEEGDRSDQPWGSRIEREGGSQRRERGHRMQGKWIPFLRRATVEDGVSPSYLVVVKPTIACTSIQTQERMHASA